MVVVDQYEYLSEEEKRLKEDRLRERYWKKWYCHGLSCNSSQRETESLTLLAGDPMLQRGNGLQVGRLGPIYPKSKWLTLGSERGLFVSPALITFILTLTL